MATICKKGKTWQLIIRQQDGYPDTYYQALYGDSDTWVMGAPTQHVS